MPRATASAAIASHVANCEPLRPDRPRLWVDDLLRTACRRRPQRRGLIQLQDLANTCEIVDCCAGLGAFSCRTSFERVAHLQNR